MTTIKQIAQDSAISIGLVLSLLALVAITSTSFSRIETLVGTIGADVSGVKDAVYRLEREGVQVRLAMEREMSTLRAKIQVMEAEIDRNHP